MSNKYMYFKFNILLNHINTLIYIYNNQSVTIKKRNMHVKLIKTFKNLKWLFVLFENNGKILNTFK